MPPFFSRCLSSLEFLPGMPVLGWSWAFCHLQQIEKESVSFLSPPMFAVACRGGAGSPARWRGPSSTPAPLLGT